MISAIEFGRIHGSCVTARAWRASLPPGATQADAWLACERGDWLMWMLERLPADTHETLRVQIEQLRVTFTARAIKGVLKLLDDDNSDAAHTCRRWGERWLSGEDRTQKTAWSTWWAWWSENQHKKAVRSSTGFAVWLWSAEEAAKAAASEVASANEPEKEQRRQANEIRDIWPVWPGNEEDQK